MKPENESDGDVNRKSGLAYAAGFALFASVIFLLGVGYVADRFFNSSPWGILIGIIVGAIIGLYQFIKISSSINS